MNRYKKLQFSLKSWLLLVMLVLFHELVCFSATVMAMQATDTYKSFGDWCLNKDKLAPSTRHTVDVLLQKIGTQDCKQANGEFSDLPILDLSNNQIADLSPLSSLTQLTRLYLNQNQIADLSPLSSLTHLTRLDLSNNQIADLQPLSSLTGITDLGLSNNQIADLQPLSSLTQLFELDLDSNQIEDLKPLSSLTKLSILDLEKNPKLTNKTCPVSKSEPVEPVCHF